MGDTLTRIMTCGAHSYKLNARGTNTVNALNQTNVLLLNNTFPTKISRNNQSTAIDLIFASTDIANKICWVVFNYGFDNFQIHINVCFHTICAKQKSKLGLIRVGI